MKVKGGLLSFSSEHKSEASLIVYGMVLFCHGAVTQITGWFCLSCLHAVHFGWSSAAKDPGVALWETQEWTVTSGSHVRHITGINMCWCDFQINLSFSSKLTGFGLNRSCVVFADNSTFNCEITASCVEWLWWYCDHEEVTKQDACYPVMGIGCAEERVLLTEMFLSKEILFVRKATMSPIMDTCVTCVVCLWVRSKSCRWMSQWTSIYLVSCNRAITLCWPCS